jgi:C4-dicarboxylate-specific signal transduction histidine kinase
VIAAQQSYATQESLTDTLDLEQIMEDAITIQENSIARHHIRIEKHYQPVPKLLIQKVKLVHILINLIKNAKDAMMDIPDEARVISIRIEKKEPFAYIRISDVGHGIKKGLSEKIFSHGFSTKTDGHGFGLHSSANYMTEMGSKIWAESEGEGKGATFVLQFPLSKSA